MAGPDPRSGDNGRMRSLRILPPTVAAAGFALLLLAGCTPSPAPSDAPSRTRTAGAAPSRAASPSPSGAPTASSGASPVSIPCPSVVSNQTVYDYNPIYSAKSPVSPAAGTPAARVAADRGTVCEWVNTSSGVTIDVAIGKYSASALASIRDRTFTGGAAASGYGGDAGYFAASGGVGTASALVGPYWVTVRGEEFLAPSDAGPFITSAVSAARNAG